MKEKGFLWLLARTVVPGLPRDSWAVPGKDRSSVPEDPKQKWVGIFETPVSDRSPGPFPGADRMHLAHTV
ncbi:MAG: hypothetical protein ACP5OP_03210 [Leptospirillia bacterium]